MNKYEKYKNRLNNTNTSINFIMDSLNKPDFEIIKEINQRAKEKEKEKIKSKLLQNKNNFIQTDLKQKKAHNKLESFILSSTKKYTKYNKVPHQSNNKLKYLKQDIMHQERGSNISIFNYSQHNASKSLLSESNESKYVKTIKNTHSMKKTINNYESKYTINKGLKKNLYNNSSYKKNMNLRQKQKLKIEINEQKFNSFKKVPSSKKIKTKEINVEEIFNNYFILNKNNKSDLNNNIDNSHPLYIIDDEQNNIYQNINNPKKNSNKNDYDLIINNNEQKDINIISFELLKLNERNWFKELNDISNLLIEKRDCLNDNAYNKYIHKMVKIHEHYKWLVNSLGIYFHNIFFENIQNNNLFLNINNLDLPKFEYIWFKGFKWKGLFIKVIPQNKSKYIINEVKALNFFFLDYIQIIDKYRNFQNNKNPLSNYIIFPLISYSEVNSFILYASLLIDLENNIEHEQSIFANLDEIIKENKGYVRLYSNLNNISYYISVNTNKIYNQNNIINNNNPPKLFINSMETFYDINDLLCSKLFTNLNIFHFLKFQQEKFLIFNLAEFIPKLFETKINSVIKLNFFYVKNNIR